MSRRISIDNSFFAFLPGCIGLFCRSPILRWRPLTNRIEPALMERMAAQQASKAQRDSAPRAVFLDSFQHVFRTGWMEAAGGWQQRRKKALVETQSGDYRFPHCVTNRSTARRSSSGDAVKAARRGLITMSHCGPISGKRTRRISRNRLFTRLRFTAFPNARGTVNPSLGPCRPSLGTCRQNAAK